MTGKIVKVATLKQKLAKESKRWLAVGVASAALGLVVMSQSNVASAADDPSAETTQPAAQTQDVTINQKTSTNVVDQNGNQLASQSSPSRFDLTVMDSGLITAVRDSDVKGQITDKVPAGSKLDSVTLTLTNTGKNASTVVVSYDENTGIGNVVATSNGQTVDLQKQAATLGTREEQAQAKADATAQAAAYIRNYVTNSGDTYTTSITNKMDPKKVNLVNQFITDLADVHVTYKVTVPTPAPTTATTPTTPATTPIPEQPHTVPTVTGQTGVTVTEQGVAAKGQAVYAVRGLYMYNSRTFAKSARKTYYAKQTRVNRPMFVVTGYARSKTGALRYIVRDVNHTKKTDGWKGYITANRTFVVPVYYRSLPKSRVITVINKTGVKAYKNVNLTGATKHYRKGAHLKVAKIVTHHLTTRYVLSNGTYITANKKLIIAGRY